MFKVLLGTLFLFQNSWAVPYKQSSAAIINPGKAFVKNEVGKSIVSYRDYADTRIDSDLDGKVDYWLLKKGPLEVAVRYVHGTPSFMKIKKVLPHQILEAIYQPSKLKDRSWELLVAAKRKPLLMHGDLSNTDGFNDPKLCPITKSNNKNDLISLAKKMQKEDVATNIEKYDYIDSASCADQFIDIESALADLTFTDAFNQSDDIPSPVSNCIEKNGDTFFGKSEDGKLAAQSASASYQTEIASLAIGDTGFKKGITCEVSDKATEPTAVHQEGGGIRITFPRVVDGQENKLKDLLLHELLHRTNLKDETTVKKIVHECTINKNRAIIKHGDEGSSFNFGKNSVQNAADKIAAKGSTEEVQKLANAKTSTFGLPVSKEFAVQELKTPENTPVDMAKEIATATPIPSAETLAQTTVQKTPEGISDAVNNSYSEGAPVLRMANQVMGTMNTPALADTSTGSSSDSYVSSSDSYTDSSRSTSPSRTIASTSNGRVANITSRNTLKADEKVVEQIDLSNSNSAMAPAATTVSDNNNTSSTTSASPPSNDSAMAKRAASVSRRPASSGSGSDLAAAGVSNPTVGSLSSGIASADSSGPSAQAQARTATSGRKAASTASSGTPSNSSSTGASKDEVVTFISNANYGTSKNKLKDPTFVNTLKVNKVTIVDLYGNSYGADKGDVIFLDEGNRFVRQK